MLICASSGSPPYPYLDIHCIPEPGGYMNYCIGFTIVYPRATPPHTRTDSPQRRTTADTAAPTTADAGNTVPQRANPTQAG